MKHSLLALIGLFCLIQPAYAGTNDEAWALGHLKRIAGFIGAGSACNDPELLNDAIRTYDVLFDASIKNNLFAVGDTDFIKNLSRQESIEARNAFFKSPPMSCEQLVEKFTAYKKAELGLVDMKGAAVPAPSSFDAWIFNSDSHDSDIEGNDILKRNPDLAAALTALKTKDYSGYEATSPQTLGPKGDQVIALMAVGSAILFFFITASLKSRKHAPCYEGNFLRDGRLDIIFLVCYLFLYARCLPDFYIGIVHDNAFNFSLGLITLAAAISIFIPKTKSLFFLLSGGWLVLRGLANLYISVQSGYDVGEIITTMPLSSALYALPNLLIAYVLPLSVGFYFLRREYFRRTDKPNMASEGKEP